ncbi:SusC/RagA family TonB-linked outer membrane protein [Echinicola pacifica]|uniref:SusC/RagA family TonB-linked outer membrane protein n=1 Tax=Echinicola pacifica TaxID=346377 RepID=A0A918UVR5_9BACT|nr:TonB-dependent receptor [Echinicola pacifica]GGZ39065.1 SusC/RagA family TonB-linked outer membrane protein [Echinicola pacifica]
MKQLIIKKARALVLLGILILLSIDFQAVVALEMPQDVQNTAPRERVEGVVFSSTDQLPLPGVTVMVKGTANVTVTDMEGKYAIEVSQQDAVLVFSFVGFVSQELLVSDPKVGRINLEEDIADLDEMVVVGYRSQKGATISGAVAPVNIENLENRRVPNVTQALQGQVAGVQITQSTGAPGDEVEIRIRGNGTIGNNNPLYVIDGVPSRDINFLNPSDIASMTVLKDAAAASIYGSRASGGVVVITTKSGTEGNHFKVNYYSGIQKVTNLPTLLNAGQYMQTVEKAWDNAGYGGVNPYTADLGRSDFGDVNYLDELFELGRTNNVDFSASGSNDKTSYLISAGYFKQNGIVVFDNDLYNRINLRSNVKSKLTDRLTVGMNLQISYVQQDKISSSGDSPGIIRHAFLRPPIIPVYKSAEDPTYSPENPFTDLPFYRNPSTYESSKYELSQNPIALAYFTDDVRSTFKTFGNIFGEYSFLKDKSLNFRTNLGADVNFFHNKVFGVNYGDDDGGGNEFDKGLGRQNRPNGLDESRGQEITITWNNSLTYDKTFGKNYITALVGSEFISNKAENLGASRRRYDFVDPNFRYIDFGNTERDLWNGGFASEWALFSYFGSGTYVYNDRYMVTTNFRADASSRFASNNKWGYFPSFSAGWMISEEDFLRNSSWLSELKLRGSWGKLGNQEIPNYAYLTLFKREQDRYLISRYGNADLKWETTAQTDIGFDLGLYQNKVYASFDYFKKTTSDILLPINLPNLVGEVAPTFINAGEVTNSGLELALSYRNRDNIFKYSITGNIASLKNEVTGLHPNLPYLDGNVTRTQRGHSLNAYYGFVQEGIYQNEEEVSQHLFGTPNPAQQAGDIKFKDLDQNGLINDNDRDFIGNPNPKISYGTTVNMNYKAFDFSILFQGVAGVDRYNDLKKIIDYDTRPFNFSDRVLSSWDGEGSSNTIPRVSFSDNGSSNISDIFVENASYLRLKNIELGYTISKEKLSDIAGMRFYISGQNLLTFTKYSGLDPESTDLIDRGTYPQSLTILLGVNVNF